MCISHKTEICLLLLFLLVVACVQGLVSVIILSHLIMMVYLSLCKTHMKQYNTQIIIYTVNQKGKGENISHISIF